MPYPIVKAVLCSWFPLCHCISKNPAHFIWVLMARNQYLIVIWIPYNKLGTFFLFSWISTTTSGCSYGGSPSSGGETSWHEWTSTRASLCVTAQLSSPFKHLFIGFGVNIESRCKSSVAALPLDHQEMEAELSLSGAWPLCPTWALRALHVGANSLIIWFNTVDYF